MTDRELLRLLARLGAKVTRGRGKGGHVMVEWRGRRTFVPTGSGELKSGTFRGILKALNLTLDDLRRE
ncbi:MAG TPA: type II toxin-antitoxin system HicA family toxin [Stellaceae bacterium]|nr:type II toxin-antitoxin system HicA family toxin [Stellaceae bacterium]